jgi:hypothetical protein
MKESNVKAIGGVLSKPTFGSIIFTNSLTEILSDLGIKDLTPVRKNGLNFSILTNKAVRIINRMIIDMDKKKTEIKGYLGDSVEVVTLKTPKGNNQYDVVQSVRFFELLNENHIKRGKGVYAPLQKFVAVSENN